MEERVAKRYAAAIFGAARKKGCIAEVEGDLELIVRTMGQDEKFRTVVVSPRVRRDHKRAILERLFTSRTQALTMDALRLLLAKRREALIPSIVREYEVLRRAHERVIHARIATTEPLTETQSRDLLARLSSQLGKKLEPEFVVEPALIGGVRISYENMVLDGSVRGGLARLESLLNYDVLKQS